MGDRRILSRYRTIEIHSISISITYSVDIQPDSGVENHEGREEHEDATHAEGQTFYTARPLTHCSSPCGVHPESAPMTEKTYWESFKAEGEEIVDKIRDLIHEGNVRRVIVQHQGRTVAEFPLTVGVVGTVFAPVLAAVGALAAVLNDCSIEVERVVPTDKKDVA